MLFDEQNLFSDAQAITASAASTNHMNLGKPATVPHAPAPLVRDLGNGQDMALRIQVVENFATLTSLTVEVQVASDSSFSSPKTVASSGAVPVSELVAGKVINPSIVPFGVDDQYLRLFYTVAGSNATAGAITAGIVAGHQTNG